MAAGSSPANASAAATKRSGSSSSSHAGADGEVPLELAGLVRLERVERERRLPGRGPLRGVRRDRQGAERVPDAEEQARRRRARGRSGGTSAAPGSLESVIPNPVESSDIETAVNRAKSASAATATPRSWIAARRRMPTPALPPIPCTSPIAVRLQRRARRARSGGATSSGRAGGCAARPRGRARGGGSAPRRQRTSSQTASATITTPTVVSAPCWTRSGRYALKRTIGRPNAKSDVACPRPQATPSRAAARFVRSRAGGDQRRHCREVVGVGRVAEAEQHRDAADDERASPRRRSARSSRRGRTSGRRGGGRARSSPGRGRGRRPR